MNRRELLGRGMAALLSSRVDLKAGTPFDADSILQQIKAPVFAARTFPVTQFGAVADGEKMCTVAIAAAIRACHQAGGGSVLIPKGRILTGAIHLESNVNLHLEDGATLAFSREPKDYLPVVFTRF